MILVYLLVTSAQASMLLTPVPRMSGVQVRS
jgi:hypothetical protein